MSAPEELRTYRILAYGIEQRELPIPGRNITSKKYTIEFGAYQDAARFQDFDGVIVFQRTFEFFQRASDGFRSYWRHKYDRDELDKRTKEALALVEQDGIVCILLADPFIDFDNGHNLRGTDLAKRLLSVFDREDFSARTPIVTSKVDELRKFFELYGAASTSLFSRFEDKTRSKTLATGNGKSVSVVVDNRIFAIPTLIPKPTDEAVEEYFTILGEGLISLWERLREDLPQWANEYRFSEETTMLTNKRKLSVEISEIERKLKRFERLKRVLTLKGEPLVEAVMEVFDEALPLKPKREEAFREDFTLHDPAGKAVALAEVKGVSKGVTREHVNQADNHRERNGLPGEFPSLLIINTNMKSSTSLADKDQRVATEQIQHAARNNVLVLRTLDLINLASLFLIKEVSSEKVVELLTTSCGWLRVDDTANVLSS
jgi:hypothetical protein